jgi:hypothetical protein
MEGEEIRRREEVISESIRKNVWKYFNLLGR